MKIEQINKNIYNQKYLEDRELVWNEKLRECKNKNIPLWNGSVYYLDRLEKDSISIGLCEYKDLLFLDTKSIKEIKKEYDLNFNFLYINVQILIKDKNNKYLFGTKYHINYTEIISVGGTLRLEDGNEIKCFEDISEYAKKEITIETKIKIDKNKLRYRDMIISSGICTFLFEYNIDLIENNLLNMGEFNGCIIIKKEDIFNDSKFKINERLMSLKGYL